MEKANSKNELNIPENIKIITLGFVNAYLIEAKGGFILVDTGLAGKWPMLETKLIGAGSLPDKLKLVIATHGDSDHIGNCRILQEKYKAKIAMHADDQAIVKSGYPGKRKGKPILMQIMVFVIGFLRLYKIGAAKEFTPDIYLKDGQDLKAYGLSASIIHVPGHTKGSIAVFTEAGDLFIGDTMVNFKKPKWANIIQDEEDLKQSREKLKGRNIRIVYPGHGRPFRMRDFIS
jgi:glyoxylase-like metal-dependent hydrolase (beta-lactamase superfamily II)